MSEIRLLPITKDDCFSLKEWIKSAIKRGEHKKEPFISQMKALSSLRGREKMVAIYEQCVEELKNGV